MAAAFLFIIFVGAVWYTITPLFTPVKSTYSADETDPEQVRLNSLFSQIREVEFEHEMGIVAKEDFERVQNELKAEASTLLNENDPNSIENNSGLSCRNCSTKIESSYKFCSGCGKPIIAEMTCISCGHELKEADKFCSQCGEKSSIS